MRGTAEGKKRVQVEGVIGDCVRIQDNTTTDKKLSVMVRWEEGRLLCYQLEDVLLACLLLLPCYEKLVQDVVCLQRRWGRQSLKF